MTTATTYNYNQILNIVRQMTEADKIRLRSDMFSDTTEQDENLSFGPQTYQEAMSRIDEVEKDIENGNVFPIEDLFSELYKDYQWLRQ